MSMIGNAIKWITNVASNLVFTGTAARVTGDFSNATIVNRVMFQSSTTNGATNIGAVPNGSATTTRFTGYTNSSDPANSSYGEMLTFSAEVRFLSDKTGSGTYLPMTFYTGGSERMRIDTSGRVGIGITAPNTNFATTYSVLEFPGNGTLFVNNSLGNSNLANNVYADAGGSKYATTAAAANVSVTKGAINLYAYPSGTADAAATASAGGSFSVTATNCEMKTANGGLGYGTGAGGTVTQATSKGTTVTLNKPCGQITMHNAALAANTTVTFQLTNSLITPTDTLLLSFNNGATWAGIASYSCRAACGSGLAIIALKNESGGSLSESPIISFAIIKGATS